MAVSATYTLGCVVRETLTVGADAATSAVINSAGFDEQATLNATSSPPATKAALYVGTLTAGALTINLAALTGLNGTQDLTGLRVQVLRVKNLGANAMTFAEGAANGIALACFPFTIPAGSTLPAVYEFVLGDASPDIASGDRTIDVTGTAAQTFEITIVAG